MKKIVAIFSVAIMMIPTANVSAQNMQKKEHHISLFAAPTTEYAIGVTSMDHYASISLIISC